MGGYYAASLDRKSDAVLHLLGVPVLTVVAFAYERWSLTRGSNYSEKTGKMLIFGKVVAYLKWSRTRLGHKESSNCIHMKHV